MGITCVDRPAFLPEDLSLIYSESSRHLLPRGRWSSWEIDILLIMDGCTGTIYI